MEKYHIAKICWDWIKPKMINLDNWIDKNKKPLVPFSFIILFILFILFALFANYLIEIYPLQKANYFGYWSWEFHIEQINKWRQTYATIIGGIGAFVLLCVQIYRTFQTNKQIEQMTRKNDIDDLSNLRNLALDQYHKASNMLLDDKAKLFGLYLLEKLLNSKDEQYLEYHDIILEILCSYINKERNTNLCLRDVIDSKEFKELSDDISLDIQAIVTVLGRRKIKANERRINFLFANLFGAIFSDSDFSNAVFNRCYLGKVSFINSKLRNASFENSIIDEVKFDDSDLSLADFKKIKFRVYRSNELYIYHSKEFIRSLDSAKDVAGVQLDVDILDIIEDEFPDLLERIKG